MKSLLLILFIFVCGICKAQTIEEIYKLETRVENTYNINVLVLYSDESYQLFWYTFSSKKMAKNYNFSDLEIEKGKWFKKDKTLNLSSSTGNHKLKFYYQNKRGIRVIQDNDELSLLKWKKVADHPK